MPQPKNLTRLLRALARQGLEVNFNNNIYSVRWQQAHHPSAEVLIPAELPVEGKALQQLATLAQIQHPEGGKVTATRATPDFHPGDAGVAIGSVIQTQDLVIPAAVGSDINCGMRLHVADLTVDDFLSQRDRIVDLLKGDYFLGTRNLAFLTADFRALFAEGLLGWLATAETRPQGSLQQTDWSQLWSDCDRVFAQGSLAGHPRWSPEELVTGEGWIRDGDLATIGGGNHFVEVQWVEQVCDRATAYAWGVREGQLAFMVHSGSRTVGKYIGHQWRDRARAAWVEGVAYPPSNLFSLSNQSQPDLVKDYLEAEATAANYGFLNRLLLAELLRLRLRQCFGEVVAPLVYDLPHNLTLPDDEGWITRKGACPALAGQPVIIPGSMGSPSYLMLGQGNSDFLQSASHGAGRVQSRFAIAQQAQKQGEAAVGLTGVDCITLRSERRIEEAPAAYKPIQPIIDAQVAAGMVTAVARLQPLLTFKA
ncbi:MAG: RtcB family protein [Spirulina sp. SIO3F2]|nr:RtcB family protein [Spirulina sp. SIO3F2]